MTDYLAIAVMQNSDAVTVGEDLNVTRIRRLDMDNIFLAARINLSEWKNNPASKQYVSFLKAKKGRRVTEYFRDFIGCQEGVDGPGETRTLLKAFSDFVESEDFGEDAARECTRWSLPSRTPNVGKKGPERSWKPLSSLRHQRTASM